MAKLLTKSPAISEPLSDQSSPLLAQRLEVLGEFAGTIANQLNNIMMAVSSYAEVELKKAPPASKRSLDQILKNTSRATVLIQKLLALSQKRVSPPRPVDLNSLVSSLRELLGELLGEQIKIGLELDPNIRSVNADPIELEESLIGLAIGARKVIPSGGQFTLSTELVKLDKKFIGSNENLSPGDYVMLSVSHPGVVSAQGRNACEKANEANAPRIDLAHAAVRRIAEHAQGLVRISTHAVHGSNLSIYFQALEEGVPASPDNTLPAKGGAAGVILVVEDDDAVRIPAAEFLMMEGFKVLQARTGPEAIEIALRNRSRLDLLITDMRMPDMSGQEVAAQLLAMHPALIVLYMSGEASVGDANFFLQKPFRLSALKNKIDEKLGR